MQDLEMQRTGTQPLNTCKGTSRKDFLWISPELQQYWKSTSVDQMVFKDHAVLSAQFEPFGKPCNIPLWRQPKSIPWEKYKQALPPGTFSFHDGPPDQFCTRLAEEFERRADQLAVATTGQALLPCQKGRSKTSEVVMVPESQSFLRPSRHGHFEPKFHGTHMQHKRWFKQLRRLEAFARSSQVPHSSATKTIH